MQVDSYFFFKCVVPENIHTSPMEGYWKFQGGGGLEVQISKGCRGEKRALPEGNLPISHLRFDKSRNQ